MFVAISELNDFGQINSSLLFWQIYLECSIRVISHSYIHRCPPTGHLITIQTW